MHRNTALDSLRGIAAVVVVMHHCSLMFATRLIPHHAPWRGGMYDPWSWLDFTPLAIVVAGKAAVMVFFVLSGFVLTPGFERRRVDYLGFAARRILRIWTPFAAVIIVSALMQSLLYRGAKPGFSAWFNGSWRQPVTIHLLLQHLAMTGGQIGLDNPMWSLVHEMRVSLIFPIIVWLAGRHAKVGIVCAVMISLFSSKLLLRVDNFYFDQMLETLGYISLFLAGSVMALHRRTIAIFVGRLDFRLHALAWIIAGALLLLNHSLDIRWVGVRGTFAGVGACMIVALCHREGAVHRHLSSGAPVWLGRISYSLYLIHVPVLLAVGHALGAPNPLEVCAIGVPLAFAAAEILHWLVERPSISASRRAETWINARLAPRRLGVTLG